MLGGEDGAILVSNDGGRSFTETTSLTGPLPNPLAELDGLDCVGSRCFASVIGSGIFRSDDGGTEWVAEVSDKVVLAGAYGTMSMFDAERAIAIGASAIVARDQAPTRQKSEIVSGAGATTGRNWRHSDMRRRQRHVVRTGDRVVTTGIR